MQYEGGGDVRIVADGIGPGDGAVIDAHARIVTEHIKSKAKVQLGLYGLAAVFMIVAALLVVFAPAGRTTETVVVASALVLLAGGVAGYSFFRLSAGNLQLQAGESQQPLRGERAVVETPEPGRAN